MNEVIRQLKARKSVRVYEERPVSEEVRAAILEAAVNAPTAGNMQLYAILDIREQEIKDRLSETCDHQPFIAKAPMVLVFCADYQRWIDAYTLAGAQPRHPGVGDLMLAVSDACIAAQNAVMAAESLGLGSCYIGDITENCEEVRTLLNLPEYAFPACMLVLGYPTEQQKQRPKPQRAPMSAVVHTNGYQKTDAETLKAGFTNAVKDAEFEDYIGKQCARKYNSAFSEEMTRSVAEYLKSWH